MSRPSLFLLIAIILLLGVLCTTCEGGAWVEVVITDDHPWETLSGRRFWYTLVYQGEQGLQQTQLGIGVRRIRLMVPYAKTVVFAAYPLGRGMPLGGAYSASKNCRTVELTAKKGALAEALLHVAKLWPDPIATISFDKLYNQVLTISTSGCTIDWNYLGKKIVEGAISVDSVRKGISADVELAQLPLGFWQCENSFFESFYAFSESSINLFNLPSGMMRYLNLDYGLELRIFIPDDEKEDFFWHVVAMDMVMTISDADYQQLLEQSYGFP